VIITVTRKAREYMSVYNLFIVYYFVFVSPAVHNIIRGQSYKNNVDFIVVIVRMHYLKETCLI
jgi:hypothetical protein